MKPYRQHRESQERLNRPLKPICGGCYRRTLTESVERMGGNISALTPEEWNTYVVRKGQRARGIELTEAESLELAALRDRLFDPAKLWPAAFEVIAEAKKDLIKLESRREN